MNAVIKTIRSDKILYYSFSGSISAIFLSLCITALFYSKLPPLIPLFNQLPWGDARLGTRGEIFIPIGIAALIATVNVGLLSPLYQKIPLLARIIAVTTFLMGIFLFLLNLRTLLLLL